MIKQRNIPTPENQEEWWVKTNRRTERFFTLEAAHLFIDLHCYFGSRERLVETNAI